MKTTLDGVVFLLPHVSSHAKTEFHRRRIFPGPREEGGNGMRRPGESCRTRTVGRQNEAAERDGRTRRQDRAAGQSGRTERQNRAARRIGRTERQDGAAGRSGKTERQDGAARRSGKTERQKKRGRAKPGHRSGQVRGRRPHKQKKRARPSVPPVLAPGFQPPGAAGQRKSARRSGPASAKGQRTGSQYAVRTPGRVQYYPHGRR